MCLLEDFMIHSTPTFSHFECDKSTDKARFIFLTAFARFPRNIISFQWNKKAKTRVSLNLNRQRQVLALLTCHELTNKLLDASNLFSQVAKGFSYGNSSVLTTKTKDK